jgi:hypothetical protein
MQECQVFFSAVLVAMFVASTAFTLHTAPNKTCFMEQVLVRPGFLVPWSLDVMWCMCGDTAFILISGKGLSSADTSNARE